MMFREVIFLISTVNTENFLGDIVKTLVKSDNIFADKQSVKRNEFYQATATGLKPEIVFIIRTIDYNNEPMLEFNSKQYNIIRTYEKDSEFIELICSGTVNGGG